MDKIRKLTTDAGTTGRSSRHADAFTLVEMLVAIGAVALVSVGLAAIFQTVGKTVTTGKRVSLLTQQAAILEEQMREDFAHMTRDGFMVIRHQFTIDARPGNEYPQVVAPIRYKGDPNFGRPRRIDELMFFANGEYRTSREDMIPGRTAHSRAARIYYGHGAKGAPQAATATDEWYDYFNPEFNNMSWYGWESSPFPGDSVATTSQHRLGGLIPPPPRQNGGYQLAGVNYYAADWNLLRHATVLQRPTTSAAGGWPSDVPVPVAYKIGGNPNFTNLATLTSDSYFQIAGQPASPSIFRTLAEAQPLSRGTPEDTQTRQYAMFWPTDKPLVLSLVPRFGSGVVDIAATDLDEISLVVNGILDEPSRLTSGSLIFIGRGSQFGDVSLLEPAMPKVLGQVYVQPTTNGNFIWGSGPTEAGFARYIPAELNKPAGVVIGSKTESMQAWMLDAMPTPGGYMPTTMSKDSTFRINDGNKFRTGARIRYEEQPPDVRGTLDLPNTHLTGATNRDVTIRRTDLLTAGLSRIAAHCSEFVVEWSWGQTYPIAPPQFDENGTDVSGQTIWYGRSLIGYNANGSVTINNGAGVTNPDIYRYDPAASYTGVINSKFNSSGVQLRVPALPPEYQPFKGDLTKSSNLQNNYKVKDWLIHGAQLHTLVTGRGDQSSLVSYFGYYDPTFAPDVTSGDPPSLPWPWPKMIRVTFTLTDPNDPSIEQSFQYVFNVPPDPKS